MELKNCTAAQAAQQAAMLPSYVGYADYAVAFYIAAEAAKNAQFLYETCEPYQRYGQGFSRPGRRYTGVSYKGAPSGAPL